MLLGHLYPFELQGWGNAAMPAGLAKESQLRAPVADVDLV